jgi:predicted SAM-dependent methyltransferase
MILTSSLLEKISFKRPIDSYAKTRFVYSQIIRNKLIQKKINNFAQKQYLNVGCGSNVDNRFVNLDYNWQPGIDLCWDITKGIPLSNDSLSGIYTEHCLEHLDYENTKKVLSRFFELLKPGGTLRVIVPDAEIYLDAYQQSKENNQINFPYGLITHNVSDSEVTPMVAVNSMFRGHDHKFAYDYLTFKLMLENVGFIDLKKESFRQGRDSVLLIDSDYRACESLYVEATKPSN